MLLICLSPTKIPIPGMVMAEPRLNLLEFNAKILMPSNVRTMNYVL